MLRKTRRKQREKVLEFLYRMEIGNEPAEELVSELKSEADAGKSAPFTFELFSRTCRNLEKIDGLLSKYSKNWNLERVGMIDRNIMRMAVCEMLEFVDIPVAVTIDEAIELSKKYSTPSAAKFVNGVLDRIKTEVK